MRGKNNTEKMALSVKQHLTFALSFLSDGCFSDAATEFKEILKQDFANESAEIGGKYCNYWKSRIEKLKKGRDKKSLSNYETGSLLYEEWKKFISTFKVSKESEIVVLDSVKQYVLGLVLECLKKTEIEGDSVVNRAQLFALIGALSKELGQFDNAVCYFQKVIQIDHFNADAYAQLGNCYELQGNERAAKIMMREAFFLNPAAIDIAKLENSQLIAKISSVMKQYDIAADAFVFWIPVYARVYNILDVKRELMINEIVRIQKEISDIKNELENNAEILKNKNEAEKFRAMLVMRYLWLYDYFLEKENAGDELKKVEACIKELSFTVYNILKNSI